VATHTKTRRRRRREDQKKNKGESQQRKKKSSTSAILLSLTAAHAMMKNPVMRLKKPHSGRSHLPNILQRPAWRP